MKNYLKYVTAEEILYNCKKEMDDMYACLDEINDKSKELRLMSKKMELLAKTFSRELQKIILAKMNDDEKLNYITRASDFEQDFVDDLFMSVGLIVDCQK